MFEGNRIEAQRISDEFKRLRATTKKQKMPKLDMDWKGGEVRQILGRVRALAASNSGSCIMHRIVCQLGRSDIACEAIADLWNAVK
jgi:hypothetical protein